MIDRSPSTDPGQVSSAGEHRVPAQCLVPQVPCAAFERVTLQTFPRPTLFLTQIAPPVWACAMTGFGPKAERRLSGY